jgi:hypothetical protein
MDRADPGQQQKKREVHPHRGAGHVEQLERP